MFQRIFKTLSKRIKMFLKSLKCIFLEKYYYKNVMLKLEIYFHFSLWGSIKRVERRDF